MSGTHPKRKQPPPKNSPEGRPCREDEILREVHSIRDAYSAELGHDLNRIFADLKRREASSTLRKASTSPRQKPRKTA